MSAPKQYQVTAATVVAQFDGHPHESYFGRGAILPTSVTEASIEHLLSVGLIELVGPVEVELILVQPTNEPPTTEPPADLGPDLTGPDFNTAPAAAAVDVTPTAPAVEADAAPRRTRPARPASVEA